MKILKCDFQFLQWSLQFKIISIRPRLTLESNEVKFAILLAHKHSLNTSVINYLYHSIFADSLLRQLADPIQKIKYEKFGHQAEVHMPYFQSNERN